MPFNGSGTFVPVAAPNWPAVSGTTISASAYNVFTSDVMNNGLSNCLTRDGQGAVTANFNMGGYRIVNAADPVNVQDVVTKNYADMLVAGYVSKTGNSTVAGTITATGFVGPLTGTVTGNVTGNVSGSSGSCTGNAATATVAAGLSAPLAFTSGGLGQSNLNLAAAKAQLGIGTMANRAVTISTSAPSGGADGDVWLKY